MFKQKHHNRQNGAALLIILAMIVIAVTAVTVTHLSLNAQSLNRAKNTTLALSYSKNILFGYALSRPIPGTLPCPDIDNDGYADPPPLLPPTTPCTSPRGLLPYKTLGIERQVDGADQPLWYVVDTNYAGNITAPHNSSKTASLQINTTQSFVFILIASNVPLLNQVPALTPPLDASQFLEGDNGDNTLASYSNSKDETHNDSLLGVSTLDFWTPIEKMVLDELEILIDGYVAACGQFPWAANFNDPVAKSVNNNFQGGFPFNIDPPLNWGGTCSGHPIPVSPVWEQHWRRNLYYAMCNDATPTSLPTNCLTLITDSPPNKTAAVIIIAPSVPRGGQNRTIFTANHFFEGNNISPDNTFDFLTPGANNNDSLRIVTP
jgi:hypothetical protein